MGGMEEEDRQTKGGRIFSRQTYIYGVGFVETGWERRRWVRSIYRQTSLRDGVCRNMGGMEEEDRQSKPSVLATIFQWEGIVAMAGRVEVGLKQIIFQGMQ